MKSNLRVVRAACLGLLGPVLAACTTTEEPAMNRLGAELSPYLQQHADNPVDWYPWGEEAFARAKREDKPIFLSIGYSTCHWCHVMEHESFEDAEVAALMNETFVSIKVDREERPDIDSVYMTVCQMLTGSGGWPLTIIMTPDAQPFYAATYIPRDTRQGRPGMLQLIPWIGDLWREERDRVLQSAGEITAALLLSEERSGTISSEDTESRGTDVLDSAYAYFSAQFDPEHGGFGSAPKFPSPHTLGFLLRYYHRTGEEHALQMVEQTLRAMRAGGMYDHVGFGFHRYSTDRTWRIPHFEKMLYDQALLILVYLEAFQVTGDEVYASTAREILTYVLRDLRSPEGGFFSAEDADSEGEEGRFYLWDWEELAEVLGPSAAELAPFLHLSAGGNFTDEASGRLTGDNIIYRDPDQTTAATLERSWEQARVKLFERRNTRERPLRDEKILTDWNGLMIAALARGGAVLDSETYLQAAAEAADFALEHLRSANGELWHRYRDGVAGITAHAHDYAFLTYGLLELYQAGFDPRYLSHAVSLGRDMIERFWDDDGGGFFTTADEGEQLLVRQKDTFDGAIPSANSVGMLVMLTLARITGDPSYESMADSISARTASLAAQHPSAFTFFLSGLDFAVGPSREIVIAGHREAVRDMHQAIYGPFIPRKVVIHRPPDDGIVELAPYLADYTALDGAATAYVCSNQACELPTTDIQVMLEQLSD